MPTFRTVSMHIIMDNYATHKTAVIRSWLARRPHYHVHFTPTSASWINQVERWFAELTRPCGLSSAGCLPMHLAWTLRHAARWHHSPCRRVASLLSVDRPAWQGHWRCRSPVRPSALPGSAALGDRRAHGFWS